MKLSDFEIITTQYDGRAKYPGKPYLCVHAYSSNASAYLSNVAMTLLEVRVNESIRYVKRDESFYIYRVEFGLDHSYKVLKATRGLGGYVAAGAAVRKGLAGGEYMLADPVHIEGKDLFELVTLEEWNERNAA